jgi:hypothetical protein
MNVQPIDLSDELRQGVFSFFPWRTPVSMQSLSNDWFRTKTPQDGHANFRYSADQGSRFRRWLRGTAGHRRCQYRRAQVGTSSGKAVVARAIELAIPQVEPDEFSYTPGRGVRVRHRGEEIVVCSLALLAEEGMTRGLPAESHSPDGASEVCRSRGTSTWDHPNR